MDNALSPRLADGLRNAGYEACHVRDWGLEAAPDTTVFEAAEDKDVILISADTDFGAILASRQAAGPSLILLKRKDKRTESLLKLLLDRLPQVAASLEQGAVVAIDDRRIRIRTLPILRTVPQG